MNRRAFLIGLAASTAILAPEVVRPLPAPRLTGAFTGSLMTGDTMTWDVQWFVNRDGVKAFDLLTGTWIKLA